MGYNRAMPKLPSKMIGLLAGALVVSVATIVFITFPRKPPDPQAVFWDGVTSTMNQKGLTCSVQETAAAATTKQTISLDLASKNKLRSVLSSTQKSGTSIVLEEVDLPAGVFVRYTSIETTEKNAAGQTPDFSKVLNVWSKNTGATPKSSTLFGRTALGNCIVPLADMSDLQTAQLAAELKKGAVFKSNPNLFREETSGGKPVYVYNVSVQPSPYVNFMKKVGKVYGLKDLDSVDTTGFNYKTAEKLKFFINPRSHQLQKIEYIGKTRSIEFSDYGVVPNIMTPTHTISTQELQQRLQTK